VIARLSSFRPRLRLRGHSMIGPLLHLSGVGLSVAWDERRESQGGVSSWRGPGFRLRFNPGYTTI